MFDFSDAKTSIAFGKANEILGNKVVSHMVIKPRPEKFPLNLLLSISMLGRDTKEA